MDHDAPHLSVIIPAFNEEAYLPRLLRSLDLARARYRGAVEVIVADNASTDRTAEVAASTRRSPMLTASAAPPA